jgi:hypothetical protein
MVSGLDFPKAPRRRPRVRRALGTRMCLGEKHGTRDLIDPSPPSRSCYILYSSIKPQRDSRKDVFMLAVFISVLISTEVFVID